MLALPLCVAALVPTIWIVDAANGPGTNFTDLPPAVAAAQSGDTILIRAGTYSPFSVTGKALTIRGAGAVSAVVSHAASQQTSIASVPAGSPFYVSGVAFTPVGGAWSGTPTLGAVGASTDLVLADVTVTGFGPTTGAATAALHLSSGAVVHASRCTFTGGFSYDGSGGAGAVVGSGCKLAADASSFNGGGAAFLVTTGGAGLSVQGGQATLAASSAHGGSAAFFSGAGAGIALTLGGFARIAGTAANVIQPGTGVAPYAISANAISSAIVHGTVTLLGATNGPVTTGAPALPYLSMTGSTTPAGELLATQPVTVTFDGAIPLAPFACLVDVVPAYSTMFAPFTLGALLLPVPMTIPFAGTLDAVGTFQVTLTPTQTIPALLDIPIYAQFGVLDSVAAQVRLSNAHIRIFKP